MADSISALSVHRLESGEGIKADITNIGARIMRLEVDGIDVVLGFDSPADYLPESHLSDFGAVIGRYANRIAAGRVVIEGCTYQLPQNNGPNCLHGGPRGWQYSIFEVEQATDSRIALLLASPDGDNGFPGEVRARIIYSLVGRTLRIDYEAHSNRTTPFNITNHSYFNLDGASHCNPLSSIHSHLLQINADRYTPTDSTSIPLSEHQEVAGTPFDFRSPKPIGRDIEADHPQLVIGRGYDHNFVLRQPSLECPAAILTSPLTGITMRLFTTAPGLQLYTGNFLDGIEGKEGVKYAVRSAVCLEAQQYPDSPNRHWPESTGLLHPAQPFHSTTLFQF